MDSQRTCGWCGTTSVQATDTNCTNCGGPLPAFPRSAQLEAGLVRAERPPDPPRELPSGYPLRVLFTRNVYVIIGVVFVPLSVPFALGFGAAAVVDLGFLFGVLGGLAFGVIGVALGVKGLRRARSKLDALRNGVAADGMVLGVSMDTSQSINGRHPWRIEYVFDGPSGPVEGAAESWDRLAGQLEHGEPVWVVYVRSDPARNAIWPPVR